MNDVTKRRTYEEFKQEFDENMRKTAADMQAVAEDFVVTGYLLREAEDTDILRESGYTSMGEFALQCYGISKDLASRYIAINKKYSEGGYSKQLDAKYTNFGYSKLAEMLTLPEVVADEISPEMTREDIREIKSEIKEENAVTDIEVMLEAKDQEVEEEEGTLAKVLHQICHENSEIFKRLWVAVREKSSEIEYLLDSLAPSGIAMLSCRIPGTGRLMMSVKGTDENLQVINVRSNEKEEFTWEELRQVAVRLCKGFHENWKEAWEEKFSEKLPEEKQEVAPAQPKAERVVKAKPKKPEKPKVEDKPNAEDPEPAAAPEEQLPGQMEVEDFPEMMPEQEERDECEHDDAGTNGKTENAEGSAECIPEDLGTGEPASTGNRKTEQEAQESNAEGSQKENKNRRELTKEIYDLSSELDEITFDLWIKERNNTEEQLIKALENAKKLVQMIEQLMEMEDEE